MCYLTAVGGVGGREGGGKRGGRGWRSKRKTLGAKSVANRRHNGHEARLMRR